MNHQPSFSSFSGKEWGNAPLCTSLSDVQTALRTQAGLTDETEYQAHISPSLGDIPSPWDMKDMDTAVKRICRAIRGEERIIIFGDFDTDGITSTSLLVDGLRTLGATVSYRIPDRARDSHGLKTYLLNEIIEAGAALLITVDCGVNDAAEVAYAKKNGIDVIITDHHASDPDRWPRKALAVLNPARPDATYPHETLAGVGVAFKLLSAMAETMLPPEQISDFLQKYLELCAIGLIADCVPLRGENRTLTWFGLRAMAQSRWPGLRHILADASPITAETVSFQIAPRLNAASRMGNVLHAVQLFLGDDGGHAERLEHLEELNTARKAMTQQFLEKALGQVKPNKNATVVWLTTCPAGICGLVAGKLAEAQTHPVVVISRKDGESISSSCRSPQAYNMVSALEAAPDLFTHFGGHAGAAGFVAKADKLEAITAHIYEFYANQATYPETIQIAAALPAELFSLPLNETLSPFHPFGVGNREPIFQLKNATVSEVSTVGKEKNHLRLTLKSEGSFLRAMAFFRGEWATKLSVGTCVDALFTVGQSTFRGQTRLELRLIDARPSRG